MRCYHPNGVYVWDTWYYVSGGKTHCIFLQQPRPGHEERRNVVGTLGHATSSDLLNWKEEPAILKPGAKGQPDDGDLWTGCVYVENGKHYLYYTGNHFNGEITEEGICLAISDDGFNFKRYENNPIIIPSSEFFATRDNMVQCEKHGFKLEDCRDMCVVKDRNGNGYWGYYAVRMHSDEASDTSVIAYAHSDDLVHWEQKGPCFRPKKYGCVEVPEVFFLDGKWHMICLTGNMYGQRFATGQSNWSVATIQAVADSPKGPFSEIFGKEIIGSYRWEGFSSKTLEKDGHRYLFYTQGEDMAGSHFGSVSLPSELKSKDGYLVPCWCDVLENLKGEILVDSAISPLPENDGRFGTIGKWNKTDDVISAETETDWSYRVYSATEPDSVIDGTVSIGSANGAGYVFRAGENGSHEGAYAVILDPDRSEIMFMQLREFNLIGCKKVDIKRNRDYNLKVISVGNVFTVYLDGELVLQLFDNRLEVGKAGLYVERGSAKFKNVKINRLAD